MKQHIDGSDEMVENFFGEMKKLDIQRPTPSFDEFLVDKRNSTIWWPWIAASLVMLLIGWQFYPLSNASLPLVIEMPIIEENASTASLATHEVSLHNWQSPTQSLIADF